MTEQADAPAPQGGVVTHFAIVGSRNWPDDGAVERLVAWMAKNYPGLTIVSGGARGVDTMAERAAWKYKLPILSFPANWEKYGRRAGFVRNKDIVENADLVAAFWDGRSPGTKHTIGLAAQAGKLYHVYTPDDTTSGGVPSD